MAVRASSESPAQERPETSTSPPSGRSRSPAICKSVDLPAPDGATSATISPRATSRLAPFSTVISASLPRLYIFSSPVRRSTGSLITQRLHRVHPRRAPGRKNRDDERQRERECHRRHHITKLQFGG